MFFQRGQVTILALLIGLLGLTISLSVASRSLSDFRQVTVVDQGTKALAAAEAGVQYALNQLSTNPGAALATCDPLDSGTASLTLTNISGVKYNVCGSTADYAIYPVVAQDDVVQVDISKMQANNVQSFYVLWKNPNAAVEIVKIDQSGNALRWVYNGVGITGSTNNFAPAVSGSNCLSSTCGGTDTAFNSGSCSEIPSRNMAINISKNTDAYFRVKPLYASTDIAICGYTSGNSPGQLQLAYNKITAIATSSGGVTRKIQTSQISNYLPAVFDSVFYTGGSLSK